MLTKCIYCDFQYDATKGEGDHVVPRSFGQFRGAHIFRGVCVQCNNKLGALEEELIRTGPESVLKRYVNTSGRRGRRPGWPGASGIPPPAFYVKNGDHRELAEVNPDNPDELRPIDQIILEVNECQYHIEIPNKISADAVRRKIHRIGIKETDVKCVRWWCSDSNYEHYKAVTAEIWPSWLSADVGDVPAGIRRVSVTIECRFTEQYYRAIAKVAFHYFLTTSRLGFSGRESVFSGIKQYIVTGTNRSGIFIDSSPPFVFPFGTQGDGSYRAPRRTMHVICAIESYAKVAVALYLFVGLRLAPSPHYIKIFDRPLPLYVRGRAYGHTYTYWDGEAGGRVGDGVVEPLDVRQIYR